MKNKKKFVTTVTIETDYDPKDFGITQILIDSTNGSGTQVIHRETTEVTPHLSSSDTKEAV